MLRLLLLAVYSAFFVVQICLDASTEYSFPRNKYAKASKTWVGKEKYLKATNTPDVERINVLVNKRFHPENALFIYYTLDAPQPVFVSTPVLSMRVTFPHILPVLADSLRAPPTACAVV